MRSCFSATAASCEFEIFQPMLITTTPNVEGKAIREYLGIVTGETIVGANLFRDFFASVRDVVGGRAKSYEEILKEARETSLKEMEAEAASRGADAVVGVDIDYEVVGSGGSMLMVTVSGTAVKLGF
jgi:uncharacterized protein YbjQ (UPF0145 family)